MIVVHVHQPETRHEAVHQLEVVQGRPVIVAGDVHALADGSPQLVEMVEYITRADIVAVLAGSVFGNVDRQAVQVPVSLDDAVQSLGIDVPSQLVLRKIRPVSIFMGNFTRSPE